jgi:hypothetical protein
MQCVQGRFNDLGLLRRKFFGLVAFFVDIEGSY